MKRAGWYVIAGAVAGFAGVLGFHGGGGAAPTLPGLPKPASQGGRPAAAPAPPASAPGTVRPAAVGPARHATGTLEQYGYGELAVRVTVRGGQVTAVSVPVLRTAEPYSQQLADRVIPMLRSEVLGAHSARINAVSGATYTSEAYALSIQSALDKLHV
jgi:uncharacterized protein with FMN-binding domain